MKLYRDMASAMKALAAKDAEIDRLRAENEQLKAAHSDDRIVEWVRDGTHCWFSAGYDPSGDGWVRAKEQRI
jgi:hypothetical protein